MKVLLRKYGDQYYVWKDAKYDRGLYIITDDDGDPITLHITEILATKEDERKDCVQCINCGAIIKNTPEALEEHYAKREAERNCLTCEHVREYDKVSNTAKKTYQKNEDGTYHHTTEYDVHLSCKKASWWFATDINSQDAANNCVYNKCRTSGVSEIDDLFVQRPDVFEKHITADTLKLNRYACDGYRHGYFEYDLKCRGTLIANVNEMGIVDHFTVLYRGYAFYMYYSAKYNTLYHADGGKYVAGCPYDLSHSKYDQVLAKISELYKEASK